MGNLSVLSLGRARIGVGIEAVDGFADPLERENDLGTCQYT
jgi:hypothetical protein